MGLGRIARGSGISAALFFARRKAQVIVTDLRPLKMLNPESVKKLKKYKNVHIILGRHREQDFKDADIIIKNPAVKPNSPYIKIAEKNQARILTDLGLFFDYIKDKDIKVIGITGTRGKSTTATLIAEILKAKYGKHVYLGGNIGNSPLNFMEQLKRKDIVVLEMASFQLHDLTNHHFDVAVVTNVLPDHLDYYKNMHDYQADKENIFSTQTKKDYLILNRSDQKVKKMKSKAKIIYFGKNNEVRLTTIKLLGTHNLFNIDAAWQVGKIFHVPANKIKKVVRNFRGVKNRLELIRIYQGVKFYNDTTATHPTATTVALQALPKKKIILISGGNSKNLPLVDMVQAIKERVKYLILVPGNANNKLPAGLKVKNIQQAVKLAWHKAETGDVILFSPGLTWLPKINEFHRGEIFASLVADIS